MTPCFFFFCCWSCVLNKKRFRVKPRTDDQVFLDKFFLHQGALFKSWSCQILYKVPCQGKTCQFMSYTRANKTCQGKTCQGKLVVCVGL